MVLAPSYRYCPFMLKCVPIIAPKMSKNAATRKILCFLSHQLVFHCASYLLLSIKIIIESFDHLEMYTKVSRLLFNQKTSQNGSQSVKKFPKMCSSCSGQLLKQMYVYLPQANSKIGRFLFENQGSTVLP